MVVKIPLSKRGKYAGKYEALVSDCDSDLAELRWSVSKLKCGVYATHHFKQLKRYETLHRVILERILGRPLVKGEQVDHINHNGLDNRRENIRLATSAEQKANTRTHRDNASGYKGVCWHKHINKYQAQICKNRKVICLGYYLTPQEAHEAYKLAAAELFGEFANFE